MTTAADIRTAILAELEKGARTPQELRAATGAEGQGLANATKHLLRTGKISRQAISAGRWRYYIGKTAPEWTGYAPEKRKPPATTAHAMPVKRIEFAADCGRMNRVTLPAFPWDLHP